MTRKFLTPIVLPADPAAAMEAATKQYVDGKMVVTAWTALTLSGTWAWFGAGWNTPAIRKVGDEVQLRGLVGTTGTAALIGVLPVGYRPPVNVMHVAFGAVNGEAWKGAFRLDTEGGGNIVVSSVATGVPAITSYFYVSLDGIRFSVTS